MTLGDRIEALCGLALVTIGVALLSIPAALIVPGAVLFCAAVWPKRRT